MPSFRVCRCKHNMQQFSIQCINIKMAPSLVVLFLLQMKTLHLRFHLNASLSRSHPRIITTRDIHNKICPPKNFTDYDTVKREFKFPQVSEHFNFARDVLDKWAEEEKVTLFLYI